MAEEKEFNSRGNEVIRDFECCTDRYLYDFKYCTPEKGWIQYDTDQDASYYGIWAHVEKMWTFSFCEGDLTLVKCPTLESFREELKSMQEFHGDAPPWATSISEDGQVTEHYSSESRPVV